MISMHLLHNIAIWLKLELKTWPKQLLGSLPLVIVLQEQALMAHRWERLCYHSGSWTPPRSDLGL